jgi:hypothetical protein
VSAGQNSGRLGKRLRARLVELSFNQGGQACCGNSLEKAAPTHWHNLSPDFGGNSKGSRQHEREIKPLSESMAGMGCAAASMVATLTENVVPMSGPE